jgi:NADH-dependent fumarate reductase subunit C
MATRWLVDAVERGAYLFCLSSRYETLCAKAKERLLLKPDLIIEFLQKLISPEKEEAKAEFVKRNLYLLKGSLVLIGTGILASPFRKALLHILSQLRKKYGVNYSLVGDVMPFKAEELDRFVERLEEFDNIVVVGNLFRYLRDEHLEALRSKLVISFQSFPNLTAHHSDLVFASTMFHERDFINYRHGFGYLAYSQKAIQPDEETYNPYEVLSHILGRTADLEGFLSELCVDAGKLREEGEQNLKLPSIEDAELTPGGFKGSELFLYVDTSLVEELGHWNPWTHEMEKEQRARINPETARRLGIKDRIKLRGVELEVQLDSNIAKGLVFVPSEYDEFQPFDPGHRVGKLLNSPSNRYEVIEW